MDFSKLSDAELEAIAGGGQPAAPAAPAAPDFSAMSDAELEAIAGGGGAPAAAPRTALETYGHIQGLGARTAIQGGLTGMALPATVGVDAAVNAAYGAHKLAAKTGLVSEPKPESYYGKSDSYFPATSGFSEGVSELADKAGLPKAENTTERVLSAVGEGVVGGVGGAAAAAASIPGRVGRALAAQPVLQGVSGGAGAAASQGATEAGADPTSASVLGMVAGGLTGAAGARAVRPGLTRAPTTQELQDAKRAAYAAKDAAGITVPPSATQGLAAQLRRDLPAEGVFPAHDPHAAAGLAGIERLGAPDAMGVRQPVTLSEIEKVRQNVGLTQRSLEPSVRRTGTVMAEHLDDFIDGIPGAGELSDAARRANRRYAKASALDIALDKAELRTGSTGTGANGENVVRQNLRRFVEDPNSRAFRQFDAPERDAMRDIVVGDRTQNALRYLGKFAPTGPVTGYAAAFAKSKSLGAVPLVGLGARFLGDARFAGKLDRLDRLVKGGPGAVTRPSARTRANAGAGALRGMLYTPQDETGRGRYR